MSGTTASTAHIADWEKHTKGIGSKLLQKFGFKGRLGAKEDGISRAIEVNVRPVNVGLGFGNADAVKPSKDDKEKAKEKRKKKLSEAEQQAESQAWKRSRAQQQELESETKRRKKFSTDSFLQEYQTMLSGAARGSSTLGPIIDMRRKDTKVLRDISELNEEEEEEEGEDQEAARATPKIGQELLYNLTALLDSEKSRAMASTKQLFDEQATRERVQAEIASLRTQREIQDQKVRRMERMEKDLQALRDAFASHSLDGVDDCGAALQTVVAHTTRLQRDFSEEFVFYGVAKALPALLAKVLAPLKTSFLENPLPLGVLGAQWRELALHLEGEGLRAVAGECTAALQRIVERDFLSQTRRFVASQWDCVRDCEQCVRVMETLRPLLSPALFEDTLQVSLLPRLSAALSAWNNDLRHPLHTWLHPWLPLLGAKLSALYPEVRRKLVSAMRAWHAHDASIIAHIAPWLRVFDAASAGHFLSKAVLPKLVEWLRRQFVVNPAAQSVEEMDVLLQWESVLPRHQLVSLVAGEVLPKWMLVLLQWLSVRDVALGEVRVWYEGWRQWLPQSVLDDEDSVLPILSFALDVMRQSARRALDKGEPVNLIDVHRSALNAIESADYYVLMKNHIVETRFREKAQSATAASSSSFAAASGWSSSLKDIVAMFAEKHGLEFKPKFGRTADGKPVWEFGRRLCYFENNVVFVLQTASGEWMPQSIEDLLAQSQGA